MRRLPKALSADSRGSFSLVSKGEALVPYRKNPDAASVADWALEAVTWTSAKGILGGYDNHDGTFAISPDGETARVEAAKVLVATYKLLIDSKL